MADPPREPARDELLPEWPRLVLEGERVLIRSPAPGDEPALIEMATDARVRRYLGGPADPDTAAASARQKVTGQPGQFVIVERATGDVAGSGSLARKRGPWEISYQLRDGFTCRGLAGGRREATSTLLSRAYAVASSLATKQGDDAIALAMADRARSEAVTAGDDAALTAATHVLAITMRRDGHHTAAHNLLVGTAAQLDLSYADPAPGTVAAYGTLLCTAAYTSAQAGDATNADTYLTEAAAAARLLGDHVGSGVHPFSPTTVAMYRISVHTTLDDTGKALEHAAAVNPARLPTAERHGRYLVDTARAWHRHGRPDRAAHALLAAERHAPEDVARASVRDLVATLLYAPTPTPAALRDLAGRIGVS
ncbi:GNAT family N-acetyltransferase [Actinoplanes sp. L3-i22]|uniref:GNAT family N-acetyltransferase n=1 Tax=Actinoplanes sp. L3-i22 TaxID=2836373 RepID=UPI001C7948C8|nr:GNAT family N-acetyltransferase [Actinoplanes sp. L3-i22]BCY11028.1 hypothetical protein L3i22_061160 [Actinoplanes sp. L3-i22]